jgi:3-oxoacyl-[acyl-carrier-protein] synthase-3
MIGIVEIGTYVPQQFESNLDKLEKFNIDEGFIERKIGVYQISRKAADQETSDLCVEAFQRLREKSGVEADEIDCAVVCTQNPDGAGLPHTAAILHGLLELPAHCACFDISLGCSGFVYTLSIVKSFMEANGLRTGIIFTADPYSKIIDPDDKNTVLLFGDGAAATLLRDDSVATSPLFVPVRFGFHTDGSLAPALCNHGGELRMNGRAVFTYSAVAVPREITRLIQDADLIFEDFDYFLLHQGSKYIVDTVSKRLDLPADKVPEDLRSHGNTVSSTIPMLLEHRIHDEQAKRLLLCGFGVGLSTASCVLERRVVEG